MGSTIRNRSDRRLAKIRNDAAPDLDPRQETTKTQHVSSTCREEVCPMNMVPGMICQKFTVCTRMGYWSVQ